MDYSNNFIPRTFNSRPSSDFDFDDIVERDPSGRYVRYNEMLGKGAFKTVYKGFDEINGLEIAWNQVDIDELLETPQQLERLYSEINLLTRRLKHGNIIRCFHSWVDDENKTVNMITELFTSGNLRQYRKKHKYVDLKAIKNWARQILNGLQYLHTQTPCIIHRDLKCDNIFVNGNTGEVKIGDLGLAAVMQQPTAHSVIGTPEFMAPELFDEEYNELVDIYAFGLCMLEMVTCEYPYSECKNPLQIYKRVTTGIKPAGLSRVKDEQLKAFIERCLVPASSRPSAEVLLSDPFLTSNAPPSRTSLSVMPSCPSILESGHPSKHEGHSMDIDHDGKKTDPCMDISSCSDAPQSSVWTLEYSNGIKTFNLIGALEDDHSISMTLRITSPNVAVKNVHFIYDLQQDTIASIAGEMEKELGEHDISKEDVMSVMQLMEQLIVELLPQNSPHGFSHGEVEGLFAKSGVTNLSSDGSGSVQDHGGAQESLNGECVVNHTQDPGCIEDLGSSGDGCLGVAKGCSVIDNELGLTSISSLTLVEKDCDSEELKQELDAIEFEYNQYFLELMQKKEELIECAKKKWSSRRASIF